MRHTLNADAIARLVNAALVAAVKYDECAAALAADAERLAAIQTPSAAAEMARQCADVFTAQADDARQLAGQLAGHRTITVD